MNLRGSSLLAALLGSALVARAGYHLAKIIAVDPRRLMAEGRFRVLVFGL